MCLVSKRVEMLAFSVCSCATFSADTSTVVVPDPTSSAALPLTVVPRSTAMVRVAVLKPAFSTESVYSPGFSKEIVYSPLDEVVALYCSPVAAFFRVTSAPETTAPVGSVTVPATPPVTMDCPQLPAALNTMSARTRNNACLKCFFISFLAFRQTRTWHLTNRCGIPHEAKHTDTPSP